ncbi:MAG: glycosyltransferase family 1 protein [Lachnospiraceae bacterium]|jgi:glycosyltransferase involved in cell wall biosynthesis|nr:glycosyltransferase [uncultured Acetatifactor sp.]MCI8790870.1 glycosyltransferase family 1 protein [Lachnospiraceae bacterium]
MVKVLHIGLSSNYGGLETVVRNWWNIIKHDRKVGFDFLCNIEKDMAFSEDYISEGCHVHRITPRKRNSFRSYSDIVRILKEYDYDIIHFHMMSYAWFEPIIAAYKYSKAKIILHSHIVNNANNLVKKDYCLNLFGQTIIKFRNIPFYRLACGKDAGTAMFGNGDFFIIENGIDIDRFSFSEANRIEQRNLYGISDEEIVIGHVGNFSVNKNYPYLIDTFYELQKLNSKVKLLLIGDDQIAPCIHERVNQLGINDKVIFTGMVKDTFKYYSAMDIFFFPSIREGLPVSLIEAQISGLSCIVSNAVTNECKITNSYYSFSLDDNPEKTAGQISELINTDHSRNIDIVDSAYDIRNAARKLLDYYGTILKEG